MHVPQQILACQYMFHVLPCIIWVYYHNYYLLVGLTGVGADLVSSQCTSETVQIAEP